MCLNTYLKAAQVGYAQLYEALLHISSLLQGLRGSRVEVQQHGQVGMAGLSFQPQQRRVCQHLPVRHLRTCQPHVGAQSAVHMLSLACQEIMQGHDIVPQSLSSPFLLCVLQQSHGS